MPTLPVSRERTGVRRISPAPAAAFPQRSDDRLELSGRAVAEEGERDVQVLAQHETDARQLLALPVLDFVEHVVRQA